METRKERSKMSMAMRRLACWKAMRKMKRGLDFESGVVLEWRCFSSF